MPELTVAGRRAYLLDTGRGSPVVLFHSGGMSGAQWRKLIERLQPSHRVLAPDFLGMGQSEPWPAAEPFHFSRDVDLAARVLDEAGAPAHVVGHSYGGLIALQVARRDPARIRSLALFEPVAFGVLPAADRAREELVRSPLNAFSDADGGTEPWLRVFIDYWNGPGGWDHLPEAQRAAFLRVGRKLYGEVRSLNADPTTAEAYRAIAAPTLLLTGTRSTSAAQRVCALLAETLSHARLERLEGATHMAPLVQAHRVNDLIAAHVEQS